MIAVARMLFFALAGTGMLAACSMVKVDTSSTAQFPAIEWWVKADGSPQIDKHSASTSGLAQPVALGPNEYVGTVSVHVFSKSGVKSVEVRTKGFMDCSPNGIVNAFPKVYKNSQSPDGNNEVKEELIVPLIPVKLNGKCANGKTPKLENMTIEVSAKTFAGKNLTRSLTLYRTKGA